MAIRNLEIGEKSPLAFVERERRSLTIRAERIAPKYLVGEKSPIIEAEHKRTDRHPTHEARYYELTGIPEDGKTGIPVSGNPAIRVQLNHGSPADDESRLAAIAEDFLSPAPEGGEI